MPAPFPKLSQELELSIIEAYNSGLSYNDLFKKFNIKKCQVLRLRNEGKLKPRTLSESCKNRLLRKPETKSRMSLERRRELSIEQSLRNRGGKSKWFEVSGQKVQGTWERDFALKLNELNIKWIKPSTNNSVFRYTLDGKERSYAPDFFLPEYNVYLELKGYWWGNDREKMNAVIKQHSDKNIIIIERDKYKKFLDGELVW